MCHTGERRNNIEYDWSFGGKYLEYYTRRLDALLTLRNGLLV
jgi:hypothetical protein